MIALYLTEPGSVLRREGDSFIVTFDKDPDGSGPMPETRTTLLEIEPHRITWIALLSGVHLTQAAVKLALWKGIPVSWLTRSGRFLGRLSPSREGGVSSRMQQYRAASSPVDTLDIAKSIVVGKLSNGATLLRYLQSNHSGVSEISRAYQDVTGTVQKAKSATSLDELRGWEGIGAKSFFMGYGAAFRGPIVFNGRKRRPPPDPANSLLSFCYVLLASRLSGMVQARGLDPALGFLHGVRPGRESLVLDLMEEFRHPVVDRFVLRLCNLRILNPKCFEANPTLEGGVLLTDAGRRKLLVEWEKYLRRPLLSTPNGPPALAIMSRQVDRFASALSHNKPYEPFLTASDDGDLDVAPASELNDPNLYDDQDIDF